MPDYCDRLLRAAPCTRPGIHGSGGRVCRPCSRTRRMAVRPGRAVGRPLHGAQGGPDRGLALLVPPHRGHQALHQNFGSGRPREGRGRRRRHLRRAWGRRAVRVRNGRSGGRGRVPLLPLPRLPRLPAAGRLPSNTSCLPSDTSALRHQTPALAHGATIDGCMPALIARRRAGCA